MGNCLNDEKNTEEQDDSRGLIKNNTTTSPTPQSPNSEYDCLFKVLLIGDSSVGKTSICTRFTDNTFTDNFIATLGVDFKIRTITIGDKKVRLQVWDTAGQERFRTITQAYYRGAHGVILVYDITDRETFSNIGRWLEDTSNYAPDYALKMLVGNKADLLEERVVTTKEGADYARLKNLVFMEASAKTCENIDKMFIQFATTFVNK
eukprot:TRINITY_DN25922_c0_g1_i1.p1 TRINITY_DN25922_c0_g1~~TRINITY_DN25922_c0_g1_i1.p1  ORF type:complete len:206 (+),score=43.52 TRINITY_DN25922_c0_g1_i1:51-668(+)